MSFTWPERRCAGVARADFRDPDRQFRGARLRKSKVLSCRRFDAQARYRTAKLSMFLAAGICKDGNRGGIPRTHPGLSPISDTAVDS